MYTLHVTVQQVMSDWDLRGTLHEHDGVGHTKQVASWQKTYATPQSWLDEDDVYTVLGVLATWAERTMGPGPNG